ncbi:hypothetical protein RHS04_08842, partial [Rhizoctonia solani]
AFQAKIKDYAQIAQPLLDLVQTVKVKKRADGRSVKGEYKQALENAKVELTDKAKKAFIKLKLILTTNPVLQAPEYNGQSFRITTDGSKYGFGAMLLQEWDEEDTRSGTTKKISYPIAFASKRTLQTKEKYAPFLLEFAALKFAFDSFAQIIAAQDIKVKTNCKALADLLGNKKIKDLEEGNGQEETVDPDWEAHKGLLVEVQYVMEDTEAGETLKKFDGDKYFGDIVRYLVLGAADGEDLTPANIERAQKQAAHQAVGFEVAEGKLWRVAGKGSTRAPRVECIPKKEGAALARATHKATGHFGRDLTILTLQDKYFWPNMQLDVITAVTTCPRCQNFGPKLMNALLAPITRA